MNAAAGAAARGPFAYLLQTQTGQWLVLGLGAFSIFPDKMDEIVRPVLRSLILGLPNVPLASDLARTMDMVHPSSLSSSSSQASQSQPIVIQTGSSATASERLWGTVVTYAVTGVGVWASYSVLVHYLPEWAREMLPVTRHVFDKAVTNLGRGIVEVSQQILTLGRKQDETHGELLEAREDIHRVQSALGRCEDSLENAEKLHGRTARGIRLLVRAVATLVPGNQNIAEELNLFAREIHIDPKERGDYIDAQKRNVEQQIQQQNLYHTPTYSNDSAGRYGTTTTPGIHKMDRNETPRTPMTRSISTGMDTGRGSSSGNGSDEISEISVDGPRGQIIMQNPADIDVSLMGGTMSMSMYTSTPSGSAKKGVLPASTLNIQNRIDALLNHGRVVM